MSGHMEAALGIDVGGTAVKLGIAHADGQILSRDRFAFDRDLGFDEFLDRLVIRSLALLDGSGIPVDAVGIATPGYADPDTGILVDGTINVPCLKGRSLAGALRERLRRPTTTINDGLAAANAELRFGLGKRVSRFVVITIGTGIGGGLVLDGQLQFGRGGVPPEIGAITLDPAGERSPAGLRGTFEQLASASAFLRPGTEASRSSPEGFTRVEDVFEAASSGDLAAQNAIGAIGNHVAHSVGLMINLVNIEACVLGGGVSEAGEALLKPIRENLASYAWPFLARDFKLQTATAGRDSGFLGAAAYAMQGVRQGRE